MRRRRQQKLEKKLQQFRSRDGGPDTGETSFYIFYYNQNEIIIFYLYKKI